ncbi:hypothetical protein LSPH24S_04647 [Lysinibacillus sphaericus]
MGTDFFNITNQVYVVAYVIAGVMADYVFNPALVEGGS